MYELQGSKILPKATMLLSYKLMYLEGPLLFFSWFLSGRLATFL
jgi:hypothetical protein